MKNKIELEGIICKDIYWTESRTDFLLFVETIDKVAHIPCYLEGINEDIMKFDTVSITGCIESRIVNNKLVIEVHAQEISIVERIEE